MSLSLQTIDKARSLAITGDTKIHSDLIQFGVAYIALKYELEDALKQIKKLEAELQEKGK